MNMRYEKYLSAGIGKRCSLGEMFHSTPIDYALFSGNAIPMQTTSLGPLLNPLRNDSEYI